MGAATSLIVSPGPRQLLNNLQHIAERKHFFHTRFPRHDNSPSLAYLTPVAIIIFHQTHCRLLPHILLFHKHYLSVPSRCRSRYKDGFAPTITKTHFIISTYKFTYSILLLFPNIFMQNSLMNEEINGELCIFKGQSKSLRLYLNHLPSF